jgi:3-(3-hydroxy-phenyl)propionate hydroxylase
MSELLSMDEPRKRVAAEMSGLDIHYDLGAGHPLLGRRMPDLDLLTADGSRRVFSLLHDARPVLLNLGLPASLARSVRPRDSRGSSTRRGFNGTSFKTPAVWPAPIAAMMPASGSQAGGWPNSWEGE